MPPIRRAFARAMACACLLTAGPAFAQSLISGKVNTGTPTFVNDQNVPLQLDATGALRVTGGAGGGGGGASTVAGSMEQDVRATGTLNAATLNAAITTPINGQGTVGYTFTGLTGSGATLTYEQSIDGGTTWTGINAVNRGTGVPEATRTTDGQIALSATGRTNIRVRVSTAGTGTITVATNVSVREGIFSLGSSLPPGGNALGSVLADLRVAGNPNAIANPIFAQMTNLPATAVGTQAGSALTVQGHPNGIPQPVTAGNDGTSSRSLRTTTTGALEPPTAASGKITVASVALPANTSTQLVAANANRLTMEIQCGSGGVSVDERGSALTAAGVGNGTVFIPSGTAPYFTPPMASLTAVTAYTSTAQTCSVTERLR